VDVLEAAIEREKGQSRRARGSLSIEATRSLEERIRSLRSLIEEIMAVEDENEKFLLEG
jgi:hypothetical protein